MRSDQSAPQGLISVIQKYGTKDGPGLRDTVFLKGCPLRCRWCSNPELLAPRPEILGDYSRCLHCGRCIAACPQKAIAERGGEVGIQRDTYIRRDECIGCGACAAVCPAEVYERIGQFMPVDQLVGELLKDQVFYDVSGGGVTFSGGEPLLQADFLRQAAQRLKESKIHVAIETSGYARWETLAGVLDFIDLVLYDIKLIDSEKHRQYTGVDNTPILENAVKVSQRGIPMAIRLVMIPGCNDSEAEIRQRLEFVARLDAVQQVDILKYHRYGVGKYARLDRQYALADLEEQDEEEMQRVKILAESFGFTVTVGG